MKKQILFVDDEELVLQGLRRSTYPMRKEWDMTFLNSAENALRFMEESSVHVVVSDMRMPGMNGAEFLARVREVSADTVRVMLTGNADFQTAVDAVNQGHVFQFLLKPCEGERLLQSLSVAIRQHQLQSAERELLLTQLEHSQKMALIGLLSAGVSHDLNNLLTSIVLETQLAPIPDPVLGRIQEVAMRAAELTRELSGFSRNGHGIELEQLSLEEVIKSSVRIVQPMLKHRVNLCVEVPTGLTVRGNAGKLKQVIMNLLINARDAMPPGGKVDINARSVHMTAQDAAKNPKHRPGLFVCLSVRDTGSGIDAATQKRLFEPFFTTKASGKGTGLGLFIVSSILDQHQGWAEVESGVGNGTTFHVFLPSDLSTKIEWTSK